MQNQFFAHQKITYWLLRDKVKDELDRLVDTGVLAQVDEPTDWVDQMAVATKWDGSLRICIDPRFLNVALKREH